MYVAITLLMCVCALALAGALVWASVQQRYANNVSRAYELIEWATRRVVETYIHTMKQNSPGGLLTEADVRKAHLCVVERAEKMAESENFDLAKALGGRESLQARAWVSLAKII